ncbi:polymer-forming cytoskeletal protein [Natrinema hispanicum]|uniref:Polymer-forming protein n=1 Tax=Natrinema hispanicum TaxID=392421 RepID=A0A1G6KV31_9EURY|nr:polymer-forming cytoskeletal protein [Natrinema hispanicum]SDC34949.1 Polymer-forming protein [Natrinema hispanicum]
MSRLVITLGSLFIVVGAALFAGPMYGFTSLAADRGVQVSTAAGEDAYVGIVPVDGDIESPSDEAEITTIQNNVGADITTLEADVTFSSGGSDLETTVPDRIAAGDTAAVTVSCVGQGGQPGTETTTVDLVITEASTDDVTVTDMVVQATLTYDCNPGNPGGGPPGGSPGNDVDIGWNERRDGDIDTGGSVSTGWNSAVDGSIDAGGDVTTGSSSDVNGDIIAGGDVTTRWNSSVDGNVDAAGDVSLGSSSAVGGDVTSDGTVTVGWNTEVGGDIDAGGDIIVNGGTVDGDIDADGDIVLRWGTTVQGDVHAGQDLTMRNGVVVEGELTADGTYTGP